MKLDDRIKNNPLLYKTFLLALEIIKLYKYLTEEKHEYVMSKQLSKAKSWNQKSESKKEKNSPCFPSLKKKEREH